MTDLKASVAPNTGLVTGSVMVQSLARRVPIHGVLLQKQNTVRGNFRAWTQAGYFRFSPD
jgi:hypothetical protein